MSWPLQGQEEEEKDEVLEMFKDVDWHPASVQASQGRGPWEAGLKVCIRVNFELGGPLMVGLGWPRSL